MEIITGIERWRRWRLEQKLRIVAETEQPGVSFAAVARRYELSRDLLWNWRSQVRRGILGPRPTPVFLPVQVNAETAALEPRTECAPKLLRSDHKEAEGRIEITLPDGTAIRVGHDVSVVSLRRVLSALRR
jgi:transposase